MNTRYVSVGVLCALVGAVFATAARAEPSAPPAMRLAALGTAFTYQGQLKNAGAPANGACDMAFRVYDAASGGSQVGTSLTSTVAITNGLFTTLLDFGAGVFTGDARWLDARVRCPSGSGAYAALTPRQAMTAVPYALFASNASMLGGQEVGAFVTITGTHTISGLNTFAGGVRFADGTVQNTAYYRPSLPGAGSVAIADGAVPGQGVKVESSSIIVGSDGLGLIVYQDTTNTYHTLKVVHCGDLGCQNGNVVTQVGVVAQGGRSSISVGADGLGLIIYHPDFTYDLRMIHCGNSLCSGGNTLTTPEPYPGAWSTASLTIGSDGLAVAAYREGSGLLKVAHCGNVACDSGTITTTVDSTGNVGEFNSITIGADGFPLISYHDSTNGMVKVMHCGNSACTSGNISTSVGSAATISGTSITIGADGLGLISYNNAVDRDLVVLHCSNSLCNSSNISTVVDSLGDVGGANSIVIGADGLGIVSYYDATNGDLKALHCGNAACNADNTVTTLDSAGDVGNATSITIGSDGLPLISYYDASYSLKVFRCSSTTCAANVRVGR